MSRAVIAHGWFGESPLPGHCRERMPKLLDFCSVNSRYLFVGTRDGFPTLPRCNASTVELPINFVPFRLT